MMSQINVLIDIPFEPDSDLMLAQAHLKPGKGHADEFLALLAQARLAGRPKAIFRECYIEERGDEVVRIGEVSFHSRALRLNLEKTERVFAFVATCGTELDALPLPPGDFLSQYWLDLIKAEALNASLHHLHTTLEAQYALGKTGSMSPGSGDVTVWPIEQQRLLFSLLQDGPERIGVRLTESCLMVPNKTVSGVYFPTEKAIRTCQVCKRQNCRSRQAAFDQEAWEAIHMPSVHQS